MILNIDTSDNKTIYLSIEKNGAILKRKKLSAHRQQSEKLLSAIDKLLLSSDLKMDKLKEIKVASKGSSFTSLRIGVLTANALAYALGIKVSALDSDKNLKKFKDFNIVIPEYDCSLDIKK
jgi:tRNA threonylcarbamoyladenosine biosynthesis protein TsaB